MNAAKKTWRDGWEKISDGPGGGQSSSKVVRRRQSDSNEEFFLKILSKQTDLLRRQRMYVEVMSYGVLEHPGIPKFVESNCSEWRDLDYKLYLVAEHIKGDTLSDISVPLNAASAVGRCIELCQVLGYIHDRGVIHRDIKPDNLILRGGSTGDLVLVDFGLAHNGEGDDGNATPEWEELGNRFLRLPELAGDSPNKRDHRSDITFCAGIFLYLLTGKQPIQLVDSDRQLPHQRPNIRDRLIENKEIDIERTLSLLDRAFDIRPDHRYQRASELSSDLQNCLRKETERKRHAVEEGIDVLRSRMLAQANASILESMATLQQIGREVHKAAHILADELGKGYGYFQGGYSEDPENLAVSTNAGIVATTAANQRYAPRFEARFLGTEVVLKADDIAVFRADATSVSYAEVRAIVRTLLVSGLRQTTT
jgi:eukaryotic-like serine/threonine-protein kinase